MSWWNGSYPEYVPVAKKKERALKKLEQLRKKDPNIDPITIHGRSLATTWWGKAWNANLSKYADYSYRIERGRSYVRHGQVLDLKISKGKINSLVMSSGSKPYAVTIKISKLTEERWSRVKEQAKNKIDSLQELIEGKFPKAIGEIFTNQETGLFPLPKEINFNCSCPDGAFLCKHVAAVLYGVGARLDEKPELFFSLRNVKMDELVSSVLKAQKSKLSKLASKRGTSQRLQTEDNKLSDLFGISVDSSTTIKKTSKKKLAKKTTKKKVTKKASKKKIAKKVRKKTKRRT